MQTITSQDVKDWLGNPVTVLHRRRLEWEAKQACDMRGQSIETAPDINAMGLKVLAAINYAEGLSAAYDHDPEMMFEWMREVPDA
jgi:hypothetical protein